MEDNLPKARGDGSRGPWSGVVAVAAILLLLFLKGLVVGDRPLAAVITVVLFVASIALIALIVWGFQKSIRR